MDVINLISKGPGLPDTPDAPIVNPVEQQAAQIETRYVYQCGEIWMVNAKLVGTRRVLGRGGDKL